jgi:sulfite reductase alpha subunit-like flavoprotein
MISFFGILLRDSDLLFKDELEAYIENGSLSELHLACSREQKEKVYVQHVLREPL